MVVPFGSAAPQGTGGGPPRRCDNLCMQPSYAGEGKPDATCGNLCAVTCKEAYTCYTQAPGVSQVLRSRGATRRTRRTFSH